MSDISLDLLAPSQAPTPSSDNESLYQRINPHQVIKTDLEGKKYNFGVSFHGLGKGLVKGMNLNFKNTISDGKPVTQLYFEMNHIHRARFDKILGSLKQLSSEERKDLLDAANLSLTDISIELKYNPRAPVHINSESISITFKGLGTCWVGTPENYYFNNRVFIQIEAGKSIQDLEKILTLLGLSDALEASTTEDILRMKIGILFRTHFPKKAYPLERSEPFFDDPVDQVQKNIVTQQPKMKMILEKQLPLLEKTELLTGQAQYAVPGLAQEAYRQGARAIVHGLGSFDNVLNIFKLGMLTLRERNIIRMTDEADDVIYTQMIVKKDLSFEKFYSRCFRLFFSLEILERGSYQSYSDVFGDRNHPWYKTRDNIIDFTQKIPRYRLSSHEIMIKWHIDPKDIKGLWVWDQASKSEIIHKFRSHGFIQKDPSGQETINGIPLDEFIHAGYEITPAMVRHCAPKREITHE